MFELPRGFGQQQLDSIRPLAPAILSYQTEAGEPLTKQQVSLLAREKPTKLVRVLPNDGPDELLGLVSGLSPLELDVLHLPGIGPEVLAPLKQKLSGVDVALLVGDDFRESDLAPWTRLPRFTLKVFAGDLSGMPQDLPKHQERVGQGDGTGPDSTESAPAGRIGKQLGQKMLGVFEARPEQLQGACREAWSKATQAWLEYLQAAFKDAGAESDPRELQALAEDYARSSEKQLDAIEKIDEMASTNTTKPAIDATRKARKICGAVGK